MHEDLTEILIDKNINHRPLVDIDEDEDYYLKRNFYEIIRKISYYFRQQKWQQFQQIFMKFEQFIPKQVLNEFNSSDYKQNRATRELYENRFLKILYKKGYEIFQKSPIDLLFCCAANLDVVALQEILEIIELKYDKKQDFIDYISQTRECYTVVLFTQKFANFNDQQFANCLRILIQSGVNLNRCNYLKRLPIDEICFIYQQQQQKTNGNLEIFENLKNLAQLMIENGASIERNFIGEENLKILTDMGVKLKNLKPIDDRSKLFTWVINNDKELWNFKKIKNYSDINDGEHTLLQLAVKLKHNEIVDYLLKNGSNPNLVTDRTETTPLELSANSNDLKTFQLLLKHKKTEITERQFNNFIRDRGKRIKTLYIKLLLESKKIDVNYTITTTLNTPLHYAIIFSYNKAIQQLLKRGAPLNRANSTGNTCLDLINPKNFEDALDNCLIPDGYYDAIHKDYKIQFDYNCLIDKNDYNELDLIYRIGKIRSLQQFLPHPLIHSFLLLKWYRSKIYFYFLTTIQTLVLFLLGYNFYYYETDYLPIKQIILFALNLLLKSILIILHLKLLKTITLLCIFEILTVLTMLCVFLTRYSLQQQLRAFVLIELSACFMLTISDHYRLTKWSIMIQTVIKTFLLLFLYFSVPIVAYSAAFNLLINDGTFTTLQTSFLKVFGMISGELDLNDIMTNSFGFFLFIFLFIVMMTMVLNNFWTGVAVSDIDNIQKKSEINVFMNLITFLRFIDNFYNFSTKNWWIFRRFLRNPFIFLTVNVRLNDIDKINRNLLYRIDFYLNQERQFQMKQVDGREIEHLPERLNGDCLDKIKQLRANRSELTGEDIEVIKKFCNLQKKLVHFSDDSLDALISTE